MLVKANQLTSGERLEVWRRRKGLTQVEAARQKGVSLFRYRAWEQTHPETPCVNVTPLTESEQCRYLRLKSGLSEAAIARKMGRSRYWICLMETGKASATSLYSFWEVRLDRAGAVTA